jgi:hypothetical protein
VKTWEHPFWFFACSRVLDEHLHGERCFPPEALDRLRSQNPVIDNKSIDNE